MFNCGIYIAESHIMKKVNVKKIGMSRNFSKRLGSFRTFFPDIYYSTLYLFDNECISEIFKIESIIHKLTKKYKLKGYGKEFRSIDNDKIHDIIIRVLEENNIKYTIKYNITKQILQDELNGIENEQDDDYEENESDTSSNDDSENDSGSDDDQDELENDMSLDDIHKVFMTCYNDDNEEGVKILVGNRKNDFFCYLCDLGDQKMIEWYYDLLDVKPIVDYNKLFTDSCSRGHLELAIWLHDKCKITSRKMTILFCDTCENGQTEVAEWLYNLGEIIYDKKLFTKVCKNGHLDTAKLLYNLSKKNDLLKENDQEVINSFTTQCGSVKEWLCKTFNKTIKIGKDSVALIG